MTKRNEIRVMELYREGCKSSEIAEVLEISIRTVQRYIKTIKNDMNEEKVDLIKITTKDTDMFFESLDATLDFLQLSTGRKNWLTQVISEGMNNVKLDSYIITVPEVVSLRLRVAYLEKKLGLIK